MRVVSKVAMCGLEVRGKTRRKQSHWGMCKILTPFLMGVLPPAPKHTHTPLFSKTSRVCYNSPQFWHYIPGNSFRSHRWRAQSLQNSPPTPIRCQLQVQIFTCTSDSLAICRLEVPRTLSWGMINLLEQCTELRETFYYLHHRFI